jgi:predicted nucleic acid-binding Zn ribbon protein
MSEHNQKTLKDAINAMLDAYKLKGGILQSRINNKWADMMGPMIASHTKEIKIIGSTLYIYVDSAPLKQELMMARAKIVQRINEEMNENLVKEVIVK